MAFVFPFPDVCINPLLSAEWGTEYNIVLPWYFLRGGHLRKCLIFSSGEVSENQKKTFYIKMPFTQILKWFLKIKYCLG